MGKDSWSKESYRDRNSNFNKQRGHSYNNHGYNYQNNQNQNNNSSDNINRSSSYSNSVNNRRSSEYHYIDHDLTNDSNVMSNDNHHYDEMSNDRYDDDYYDDYPDDDDGDGGDGDGQHHRKHHNKHHHRHRSHHKHHHRSSGHHHRSRDHRSRSRSREHSNHNDDSNDSYSNNQFNETMDDQSDQQRQQPHHPYHERSSYQRREEKPYNTLMLRNIPPHVTDRQILAEINQLGSYPRDVRLMRNKETGQSRGFAFIEFPTIEQATHLKELTQDIITFDNGQYECTLYYSFPKDNLPFDRNALKSDWNCPKCGINNFKRRDECFKCGTHKDDNPFGSGDGDNDNYNNDYNSNDNNSLKVRQPTNVLLIGNLSPSTNESTVLAIIGSLTALPIKSIRMINNNTVPLMAAATSSTTTSILTNTCCVELHSVYEATELYQIITSMNNNMGLTIDNHLATISYGRRLDQTNAVIQPKMVQNVASAALAAAQWKNLDDTTAAAAAANNKSKKSNTPPQQSSLETITVNGIKYQKYPPPDYNQFQYDQTSGYYYDQSTGFHYDSASQYFYNSQTQKYMYYDPTNQIYVTVDSNGQVASDAVAAAATTTTAPAATTTTTSAAAVASASLNVQENDESKVDKAKMAKKIAKDMEKWAKTLTKSQCKEAMNKQQQQPQQQPTEIDSINESISTSNDQQQPQSSPTQSSSTTSTSTTTAIKHTNPFDIIKAEEAKLIDRERLACMLCKRQFNSIDLLEKHQQLSGLHKTNLSVLRQTLLNEEQLEHVEQVEREMNYRDRAKERREKYGIDDTPEFSKRKLEYEKEMMSLMMNKSMKKERTPPPISNDNIGNRMLKAMGWTEGTGLGKSNQGMSGIIEVERRKSGLGLGNQNATFQRESYKDAVRRTALQRFNAMNNK